MPQLIQSLVITAPLFTVGLLAVLVIVMSRKPVPQESRRSAYRGYPRSVEVERDED